MDLRERLRVLCRLFRQADGDVVENAVGAAAALGSVDRCGDLEFLRSAVKPPQGQETRAAVDRLRARLAEVRVLAQVGRLNDARHVLAEIEEEIRGLGYLPLVAEMLLESGNLFTEQREGVAAGRVLEDAVWAAEVCRHDEVSAEATALLVFVVGDTQGRFDVAEVWARFAETLLRRMGGHDALWGWLFNNRGAMRSRQGRLAEALEDGREAVAAKERAGAQDSPDVAQSLNCITNWLVQLDRADEALPYIERAVRIVESTLGPDHPRGTFMLNNYAEVLNGLGRFAAAEEVARRAVAMFEREFGTDDLLVTYPMTALGIALIGTGKNAEALSILERATALCETKKSDPAHLAEVHFALARAVAAAGIDPHLARVCELAKRAADEYGSAVRVPLIERELGRIARFLVDRR
jgi:tetratricopeptide (TPR) repeat protein